MKSLIIFFSVLISLLSAYGQKDSIDFFFDEFNINLNITTLPSNNVNQKLGFGGGAYHSMMNQKRINLIFGFEYNLNRQFINKTYEGHYAHATDIQYSMHNLSVPFNFRYNIGRDIKIIMELGTFIDLIIASKRRGIMHTYLPNENNNIIYNEFSFSEGAKITGLNYGLSSGFGLKVPIKKRELITKIDYKFGLQELDSRGTYFFIRYFRLNVGIKI